MKVDRDGRVVIPQTTCEAVPWISGTGPLTAWLLMKAFGRSRLLSSQDVEANATLATLLDRISSASERGTTGPLDFEDEADVVLPARFVETRLSLSEVGWRLTLPRTIVSMWGLRPPGNEVCILISRGYIE